MKTVLIVSYHYPPEEGSCNEKNIRIVKLLIESGYNVVVLTKGYIGYNNLDIQEKCTIIRTDKNGLFHKVQNEPTICSKTNTNITDSKLKKIKSKVSEILMPDSVIDWVSEVKKTFVKHKEYLCSVDVILSISSPYSAHIASEYLSKKIKCSIYNVLWRSMDL